MTISAAENLAGQEHAMDLKIGDVADATVPLRIKVMKQRNVSVSVYPLRRPSQAGEVPELPSHAVIESYIDGIFKKQSGVDFAVTVQPVTNLYSGALFSQPASIRRWIVKREWDAADNKLKSLLFEE
jgi:hypothetical protein